MRLSNCFSECAKRMTEEELEEYHDIYDDEDFMYWANTTEVKKDDYGLPYDTYDDEQ